MREKTQKELIQELHQGIYGVPGTEEHGLIGSVKELVDQVRAQNGRIRKNEQKIFKIWGILMGIGAAAGIAFGLGLKLLSLS